MIRILVADAIHPIGIDTLKKSSFIVDEKTSISPEELQTCISLYDGLIVRSRSQVTNSVIERANKLKVIARAGTGVDNIDVETAKKKGIIVVNARGANAQSVAEHTMTFILMLARGMFPIIASTKHGLWEKKTYMASELYGKTLGIVGKGTIGSIVASIAESFGMNVMCYSRTVGDLQSLLTASDFVSLHVALTPETKHLIGKKELSLMKKTAYLINTSRGSVIDEIALVDALEKKIIAGAALDVYEKEPLAKDNPLLTLTNILLTPHVASISEEGSEKISRMIANDIVSVLSGSPARNSV